MRAAAFIAAMAFGCNAHQVGNAMGAGVSTGAGAATVTAVAAGTSLFSRSQGGCFAVCQQGEVCNPNNGLCEALPCNDRCAPDERCVQGAFGDKCEKGDSALTVKTKPASTQQPPAGTVQTRPEQSDDSTREHVPDAAKP